MKIGFAKKCITPAVPTYLSGFAGIRKAESKLDDLYVKVIVGQNEHGYVGMIAYDLIAIDDLIIKGVKEAMQLQGIACDDFMFSATHTHSGPGGVVDTTQGLLRPAVDVFVATNLTMIDMIVKKSVWALQCAINDCKEADVSYASTTLDSVGGNRNGQQFKGNSDLIACFIKQHEGKQAMIVNYACHPTILNGSNDMISSDFPGAIDCLMQEHDIFMSLYLNGSCGDISTRFSRKQSDADEVVRYGKIFEETLLKMKKDAHQVTINSIQIVHKICTLTLKKADTIEHAQAEVQTCEERFLKAQSSGITKAQLRLIESYKEGAEANLRLAKSAFTNTTFDVKLMFYKINDHKFVCAPGELFSELSNSLQNEHVHFIGYANGYLGYFAHELAYEELYYEALSSPFEKGQGEHLMKFIKKELEIL